MTKPHTDDAVYEVHMNGLQMDIIHAALKTYSDFLTKHNLTTKMNKGEIEDVQALIDMSDTDEHNILKPEPWTKEDPMCNGWCL